MGKQMTGNDALKFIKAADHAAKECGTGALAGIRLINALHSMGIELITMETPPDPPALVEPTEPEETKA